MPHRRALGISARRGLVLQMFRGLSVCLSDTFVSPAKTDEPIKMPFGLTCMGPGNHVLDGVSDFPLLGT